MAYRSMMVQIDETALSKTRIEAAAALAKRFNSALTGVFLQSESIPPFLSIDGLRIILAEQEEEVRRAAAAARDAFEAAARDAGIAFDWVEIDGKDHRMVVECARRHDLTIFPASAVASVGKHRISADHIGMGSGSPVLALPHGGPVRPIGRRVLIAWKGSRESARALNDAWPFLEGAEEVQVLTIRGYGQTASDPMLERQLRLHGCKALKIVVDADDDGATGEILRRHIAAADADLVVMGLYGHPRLGELVLGGVSQNLLESPPVPLLVSH